MPFATGTRKRSDPSVCINSMKRCQPIRRPRSSQPRADTPAVDVTNRVTSQRRRRGFQAKPRPPLLLAHVPRGLNVANDCVLKASSEVYAKSGIHHQAIASPNVDIDA